MGNQSVRIGVVRNQAVGHRSWVHGAIAALVAAGAVQSVAMASIQPASSTPRPAGGPTPSQAPASATGATEPALTPLAHVEVAGNGPVAVVLIPGLSCDWTVFKTFMDRNKSRYTMYAVTLPGFGGSQPPAGTPDPTDGAWLSNAERAVLAMIDERKLDKPLIVGHSLGAHLALRIAAAAPAKVRGAVAIDGMPAFPLTGLTLASPIDQRRNLARMVGQQLGAGPEEQWKAQHKQWFKSMVKDKTRGAELAEMSEKPPRETSMRYMTELLAADAIPQLKDSKVPMLAIAAISDLATDPAESDKARAVWRAFEEALPNLKVVYFESTRHFVMDDAPGELDLAVEAFVAGKPVPGKPADAKPDAKPGTGPDAPKSK